jgi:hypothetical protein
MKRLVLVLMLAVLTLTAPPASAKEPQSLTICGTDGCRTTRDRAALAPVMEAVPQAAPDEGGAFYRVRVAIGAPDGKLEGYFRLVWIPSLGMLRTQDDQYLEYTLPRPPTARLLHRLTRGLRAFPASKLDANLRDPESARVDEVVPAPPADTGDGDGAVWAWSLLAIPPAGIALWLFRRRRGRPSLA